MNLRIFAAAFAMALATAGGAAAQALAEAPTNAESEIFVPIVLTKNSDLSFGTIVRPSTGTGTVTIDMGDGSRELVGDGALITGPGSQASPGRATYTVVGEGAQTFAVTYTTSFNMTRVGGVQTIPVTVVSTTGATGATQTLSGSLGISGSYSFGIGGSIPISSTTTTGAYSGNFNVTVTYN